MTQPTRDLVRAFCTWLLDTGRSMSTATQYASALGSFLNQVDPQSPEVDPEEFPALAQSYFSTRSVTWQAKVTAAYRVFVVFRAEEGDLSWPSLTPPTAVLPDEVLWGLEHLITKVGVRMVAQLTWADADLERGRVSLPGQAHHVIAHGDKVAEWLEAFQAWGEPLGETSPLIPLAPGRTQPRPARTLSQDRRLVAAIARKRMAAAEENGPTRPIEAPLADEEDLDGEEVPVSPEDRLTALRGLLGREPTEQELAVYL